MPDKSKRYGFLPSGGLYEPSREHDSCGIGFIAHMKGEKSHSIIQDGIEILRSLEHRGAVGADPKAGDGAGLLLQMPDNFLRKVCDKQGFSLPKEGEYGCGIFFLPREKKALYAINEIITKSIKDEGHKLIGWRDVEIDNSSLGESVKASEPFSSMIFIENGKKELDQNGFERSLFVIRRVIENKLTQADIPYTDKFFHINSLSSRILLYKGMLLSAQLDSYFLDLQDKDMVSALALVHQRFSTNTFPSWKLAQPFRMICHNGEINTLRGNINWMAARHATLKSPLFGKDIEKLWPLIQEGQSDSACFDNALELLVQGGYPLAHAMMLLIPEAWEDNPIMSKELIAFYEHHAALMEPWDGPAAIAFTNGRQIGATLDRNGLRPARYYITKEDKIILASEAGTLPVKEADVIHKWRLQPGKMLLIDLEQGRLIQDKEIKAELSKARPYRQWLEKGQIRVLDLPEVEHEPHISSASLLDRQQAFGYSEEDIKFLLSPMAENGEEATGSMGTDTPLPALSDKGKLLYYYFKQNFAQVTNPPIDPIREELVMSLVSLIGPRPNLLDREHGPDLKRLELTQPIITPRGIEKIRNIGQRKDTHFDTETLDSTWDAQSGFKGLISRMEALYAQSEKAIANGKNILIISDRALCKERIAIPALLATAGLHHHLIRKGLRTSVGLVVETGEAREVHHIACLAGYGAEGINPYLAFETLSQYYDPLESEKNYIKAVGKGLRKVMSKMGISTYQSYCGAQIFDAVGLKQSFIDQYFTGTHSKIEGVGLEEIARETIARHKRAFGDNEVLREALPVGGEYAYRIRGEQHAWNSDTVRNLQHSVRSNSQEDYDNFSKAINKQDEAFLTLRGLFRLKKAKKPIDIAKVEKAEEIVKRFSTGAMSFGSISREAHTTLAIAMNRIGGRSNTGEGGEQSDRFRPLANGDSMRSSIKQIASGRFGVTAEYLVNSDMIQIKMAQGAKPGEGGQLPGHKVDETIAKTRHSTPGVGLISPPPHH
ncbi:MAG: glutamate synthase large subunit, partial [Parvibaculales bacterium]